jgi:gamma-glutamyltranspeptidase/glutathione hydrolase
LHKRFGSLEFETLLQPAIHYAREGHVVHERVAHEWQVARDRLCHDRSAASIFLPGGHTPQPGQIFRNPALAKSLDLIARKGRKGFYEGELAQSMVAHLRERGGLHTLEDFASAQGEFVDPIAMPYRGSTVYQLPPNTQGIIALLLLALLEECEGEGLSFGDPRRIHLAIEAARIAFSVRNDLLGDMDTLPQPTCRLLDHNWVCELAGSINPMRASTTLPPVPRQEANTVYLTVVDRDRNAASFINSIYHSFGSGLCPPDTGILLQNRGVSFQLDPQHPNVIGPGRRPMHTIIPGMVGIGDRATLAFGVMGGDYQPVGHAHVLSALYKYGADLQAGCDAPRYMPSGDSVEVENGIDQQVRHVLTTFGHHVTSAEEALGGAQLIALDWERGTLSGASDPRKDGCALGF